MNKKWMIIGTVVLVLIGTMYGTKPDKAKYNRWAAGKLAERAAAKNPIMGKLFAGVGEQLVDSKTVASDYFLAAKYETKIQGKEIKVLGICGIFIPLGKPGGDKG